VGYAVLTVWFIGFCYFWPKTVYASRRKVVRKRHASLAEEVEIVLLQAQHVISGFLVSLLWFVPLYSGVAGLDLRKALRSAYA